MLEKICLFCSLLLPILLAAKFVEDIVNGDNSFRDEYSQGKKLSQLSLKGSFEALMSLDLHSVENLVDLASTSNLASSIASEVSKASDSKKSSETFTSTPSCADMASRMESFIKSLSSANLFKSGYDSSVALSGLLQNIQNSLNDASVSSNSIFDSGMFLSHLNDSLSNNMVCQKCYDSQF